MKIAVPTEVKDGEFRVALTPAGVAELVRHGHQVFVQQGAGLGSGIADAEFAAQGATLIADAAETWGAGELVLKVKEPVPDEYRFLHEDQMLFTYLHLAADGPLTEALCASRTTAIAYETVQLPSGQLPLLYPMSEVAGCLAPQVGAQALLAPRGGRGVLMGGVGGVANAKVVVLGCGVAGQNAAGIALGMGAEVTVIDTDLDKLRQLFWRYQNRIQGLASNKLTVEEQLVDADLVIGTVLVPGTRTPKLVSNEMVAGMKPGSVLVDVSVDQGGCFEDSRPTTHQDPTFEVHRSIFYCVTNMPGAVPRTSTWALTNATMPYVLKVAEAGWEAACRADPALALGVNIAHGAITYPGVAEAFPQLPVAELSFD